MQFVPLGGFPSIERVDDIRISPDTLVERGFQSTDPVSLAEIMRNKKKDVPFLSFGDEEVE